MSCGGKVRKIEDEGKTLVLTVEDSHEQGTTTTGVRVQKTVHARCITERDAVWWQEGYLYWTPYNRFGSRLGVRDIKIPKVSVTFARSEKKERYKEGQSNRACAED